MKPKIVIVSLIITALTAYFILIFAFPEFAPGIIGPIGPGIPTGLDFVLEPQDFVFLIFVVGVPVILVLVLLKMKNREMVPSIR